MRLWSVLLAFVAAGCSAGGPAVPPPVRRPMRIMSINQCTDQLLLSLVPPERIASVTFLSQKGDDPATAALARKVGVNHGFAEEVLAQKPDLVIAGTFSTPALRGMLKRLGYPMIEVEQPASLDQIRATTRQVAAAVDARQRGEALIAEMDRKFAALRAHPGPRIPVIAWDRTGFAAGPGTLYDTVLTAAGARNLANETSMRRYRQSDVEALLAVDPALLVRGSLNAAGASLADDRVRHPLVRRYWSDRMLQIPEGAYSCGTPKIADAALMLRDRLRKAAAHATSPLRFAGTPR
jgi:iron complex transport system substrate-binding protein